MVVWTFTTFLAVNGIDVQTSSRAFETQAACESFRDFDYLLQKDLYRVVYGECRVTSSPTNR